VHTNDFAGVLEAVALVFVYQALSTYHLCTPFTCKGREGKRQKLADHCAKILGVAWVKCYKEACSDLPYGILAPHQVTLATSLSLSPSLSEKEEEEEE
jgi:hypothetical protein